MKRKGKISEGSNQPNSTSAIRPILDGLTVCSVKRVYGFYECFSQICKYH